VGAVEKCGESEIKLNFLPREASETSFEIGSRVNAILLMWYPQIIHNTISCGF
jgi:hypothetical protein